MADKTGYIGRNPNDSAVTVARQFFTASGVTTTFTFASGYLTGFLDVYVDGVKRRVADEFTATDGSTFDVLQGGVSAGSTVEAVAYKAFNAAAISGDVTGNFDVSGNTTLGGSLSVTGGTTFSNINVTGIATLGAGTTVAFANTAFNLGGTPDITIASLSAVDINVSGAATIGGILTYEDVTNIDSLGIVTARTGVEVTANGLVVNAGVSTFAADVSVADKIVHTGDANTAIRFPSNDTFTVETSGSERLRISSGGDVTLAGIATVFGATGIVSATSFDGDLTGNVTGNLTGTASNASGATGDFSIADKIVHTGDTNTAIRFPAADTFTVETAGSERVRVTSAGKVGIGSDDPSQELTVNGTDPVISVQEATVSSQVDIGTGTATGFINIQKADGTRTIQLNGSDDSYFTGGNIGIGTASPDNQLHVFGATASAIKIETGDGDYNPIVIQENPDRTWHTGLRGDVSDSWVVRDNTASSNRVVIDTSGRLLVATNSARTDFNASSTLQPYVQFEGSDASTRRAISVVLNANSIAQPLIILGKSRGTSDGSDTIVQDNDILGTLSFQGADGADFAEAARIQCEVDGTPGSNDMPGRIEFHTTPDGSGTPVERLRIDSSGHVRMPNDNSRLMIGAGADLELYHDGSHSYIKNLTGNLYLQHGDENMAQFTSDGNVELYHNNSKKFETTSTGITVTGIIVDRLGGDIRRAIQSTKTSAYTLVEEDTGRHIYISTGGVTVPNGIFNAGAMVTIVNNSGSNQTITQGSSMTMYNTADASSGNRTLAGRGVCTILFTSSSQSYISGAGLS